MSGSISKMQAKFTWVFENFSSLLDEEFRYSPPFTAAGCNWRLLAYPRGVMNDHSYGYFSVYLYLAPGSLPPGWRREVKYRITLVNANPQHNKVLGDRCFLDASFYISGFQEFLPLDQLRNKLEGFLVNDRLTIVAEVEVVPLEPAKMIASLSSKETSIKGDSPNCHQVAQETDHNAASQEKLDNDDDASEDGTDDDYVPNGSEESSDDDDSSEESSDDDDDDASEESSDNDDDDDDDDASQEDKEDDASSPVNDDGANGISPLEEKLMFFRDLFLKAELNNHGICCNTVVAVAETDHQISNGEDDDALKEDVDNEASTLVLNDSARNTSTVDQVKSSEDASQTMESSVRGINTVASVARNASLIEQLLKDMEDDDASPTVENSVGGIQPVNETMDINGFEVVSSKVESVRRIFEKYPDIAVEFLAKNQHLRNACMNFLLSLIDTMCQSLEELSNEDLVEADIALTYLRDAGFKVDWLEKKLDQLKEKKEQEQSGLARLHEIDESLTILEQKWLHLEALEAKEKAELKATRRALSFDDLIC